MTTFWFHLAPILSKFLFLPIFSYTRNLGCSIPGEFPKISCFVAPLKPFLTSRGSSCKHPWKPLLTIGMCFCTPEAFSEMQYVLQRPWSQFPSPSPLTHCLLKYSKLTLYIELSWLVSGVCCGTRGATSHHLSPWQPLCFNAAPPKPLLIFWVCCGTPEAFSKMLCVYFHP